MRFGMTLLCLTLPGWFPCWSWAARGTPPHPSGIVIHLFGNGATKPSPGTTAPAEPGITVTTRTGTTPVSLGFVKALAKMLNDDGTPVGLRGRQANLPPQSISRNQRHPGQ